MDRDSRPIAVYSKSAIVVDITIFNLHYRFVLFKVPEMTMRDHLVSIKGIKDGLLITLSPNEDWQFLLNDLATRIDEQSSFFSGAFITVDVGQRPVPKYALASLKALLERRGLALTQILSESDTTLEAAQALDLRTALPTSQIGRNQPTDTLPSINPEEEGTPGVMIRRTLRSGRVVRSSGHVVIYGDVNPGAEIIAVGDVIIWGVLRGSVHAGSEGDESAIVCALDFMPMRLNIGQHNAEVEKLNNGNQRRRKPVPEMASIRNAKIVVDPWSR
jgi:septum site-determining protein MinC